MDKLLMLKDICEWFQWNCEEVNGCINMWSDSLPESGVSKFDNVNAALKDWLPTLEQAQNQGGGDFSKEIDLIKSI